MTFYTERRNGFDAYGHRSLPPNGVPQLALRGAAFTCVVVLSAWTFYRLTGTNADQIDLSTLRGDKLDLSLPRGDKLPLSTSNALATNSLFANANTVLFDPRPSLGSLAETFAESTPLQGDGSQPTPAMSQPPSLVATRKTPIVASAQSRSDHIAQSAAFPVPRLGSPPIRNTALPDSAHGSQTASTAPAAASTFFATIFKKLFGQPVSTALAYAATDDSGLGVSAGRYDRWTAVYDISAHVVYMPDGTQLEAHSGFGDLLDDPSHADERMRGVTPPNIYDLELREELFHGIRALRMIPEDKQKTFGRSGILAHSFMLGPNGDSNGCVSFKDYDAFLEAYLNHQVKRLAVVARLD
jgi:hypothetical protein